MVRKRRKFSPEFKVDAVMDLLTGARTAAEICRERNITDKLLYRWKNELQERLPTVVSPKVDENGEALANPGRHVASCLPDQAC